jgi:peptide methionine sulfoxide reductase msrA/msrB
MDPLSVNKQGNDRGVQYRTGIYYTNPEDEHAIRASVSELEKALGKRTAIEVLPLKNWCTDEEYHQKYLDRNPGGYCHISPALFAEAEGSNPVPRYEPSPDSPLPICSTP